MTSGLQAKVAALPAEQRAVVDQAREASLEVFRLRSQSAEVPEELATRQQHLDETVLRPIRAAIGLDVSNRNFSGAAPIPRSVLEFLASVGLPVYEVWGLSETTGCATVSSPETFALGSVGPAAPGMEVMLADDGELLVRGPVVFSGYLQRDGSILPDTDGDGWLATGDIGTVDDRGIVSVTDRKKEIIITASGKNIAPTKVESLLRAHPLLAQAVAIGDQRRYVTALLVLDEEAAPAWAKAHDIDTVDLAELAEHPRVRAELDAAVAQANEALARAEQIKKYCVLGTAWTAESGELTPKLSLRRRVINERYAEQIEQMYA